MEVDSCSINVTFSYTVINGHDQRVRTTFLLDETLKNIIDQSQLIDPNSTIIIDVEDEINICETSAKIVKQIVSTGELIDEDNNIIGTLPVTRDSILIEVP